VIGQRYKTPYIALGSNPFRTAQRNAATVNAGMHLFLENSIEWLTGQNLESLKSVAIAHVSESFYFPDYSATTNWLAEHVPSASVNNQFSCDDSALSGCVDAAPDLLIISQVENDTTEPAKIQASVAHALALGVPVLYLHHDGNLTGLGSAVLSELKVRYIKDNYWSKQRITNLSAEKALLNADDDLLKLVEFIENLENNTWDFNLASCDDNCNNQPDFGNQFSKVASTIRSRLRYYDQQGIYLFEQESYELDKLIILLADKYRQDLKFPMDFSTTPQNEFLRALFTDYAQYQRRSTVPIPADLGNFSRTDFSQITSSNKSISIASRKPFRAAGVYALPGETVTVTRSDNTDATVKVFVNAVRDGATHLWEADGYKRPKYLSGEKMALAVGETISFTSTYGGPIQLAFDSNDHNVNVRFSNVGLHAYWNGSEDDTEFAQALEKNEFDWAELATPAFEVHSKLDKMLQSAADENWPTADTLAQATMTYTHNYPHVLAGYQGSGIDVVDEIHDFADSNGWVISSLEQVKHMNADQATCGYGCSGNPYDAYWSFNPVGHGDIHELGHGLERSRFRFKNADGSSWETHATTNPYSYYSKSQFYKNTAQDPSCQKLPFDTMYGYLQAAQASGDSFNYMANLNLTGWSTGVTTYIQMMMAVENQGVLQDGWHLWARLHMFEREFNRADDHDTNWDAKKANLGMPNLTREQAKSLGNNDWMVLALSFISGHDFRDFFDLYGIAITSAATTQLDTLAYPILTASFYGADGSDFCFGLDKVVLPIDGISAWPF